MTKFANEAAQARLVQSLLKSATQGYFSVSSREEASSGNDHGGNSGRTASSPNQRVRVVTTIDYYLN